MPAISLNGNVKVSAARQMMEILHRNDGIIFGCNDCDRRGKGGKGISGKSITVEIIAIVCKFRIPGHDGLGQRHAGLAMEDIFKTVELGKTALLFAQRPLPFGEKIDAINGKTFIDGQCGSIGIQSGAYSEDPSDVADCRGGLVKCNPERKISAQRKTDEMTGSIRQKPGDIADRLNRFIRQGAVEKSPVQMMASPMVSQIEAEDVVSSLEKKPTRGKDVS